MNFSYDYQPWHIIIFWAIAHILIFIKWGFW